MLISIYIIKQIIYFRTPTLFFLGIINLCQKTIQPL